MGLHEWLGWVLFAVMMVVIFQVGRRAADPDPASEAPSAPPARSATGPGAPAAAFFAVAIAVIALGATWTTVARAFSRPIEGAVRYAGPAADASWRELAFLPWDWKPFYVGAAAEFHRCYDREGEIVGLYVAYYRNQRAGAEVVQSTNGFLDPDILGWKRSALASQTVPTRGGPVPVTQIDLDGPGTHLRVWRTFWIGGRFVAAENEVKLEQLRGKLTGKGDDAAVLILYTRRGEEDWERSSARLSRFLADRVGPLERSLWYTSGRGPANAPAG